MSSDTPVFNEPTAELLAAVSDPLAGLLSPDKDEDKAEPDIKKKEQDKVRILFKRISNAKKAKEKWEQNYEVDRAHDYVRGFQRTESDERDAQGDRRYQINKILAALKTRIPALFYYFPFVRVKPTRGREDSVGSQIQQRADLLQDTLNTIVRQPKTRFKPETMLALKEAHWAFGVIEVGYEAEWGENPFAQKPNLVENEEIKQDLIEIGDLPPEDDPLAKLDEVPHSETFYLKHVPARQFYVATNDKASTEAQDWVGYWEWMYVEDVKRAPSFENTEDLHATAKWVESGWDRELAPVGKDDKTKDIPPDMVRIWRIWDQREKKRYVLAEGHDRILKVTDYFYLPLFPLRFEVMPGEWYPIPPIFNQLTEQDEFNDSREWLRLVRKGTRPRYLYDKSAFPADELEKLENDDFFTMLAVDNQNLGAIQPVPMPQISDAVLRTLSLSDAGFAEQAASSPVDRLTRGAGGKPTATEVEAMGQSGDVRNSYEQQEVAEWLSAICSGLMKCCLEKMTLPQWVLINSDPTSPSSGMEQELIKQAYNQYKTLMGSAQAASEGQMPSASPIPPEMQQQQTPQPGMETGLIEPTPAGQEEQLGVQSNLASALADRFSEVTPDQLQEADDGMQWDITVDVESLSPVTQEQYGMQLMQALNLIASPGVGQLISMAPPLLKTMLNLMGIRNATDQQSIFMALQAKMQMEQQMAMAGAGQPPGVAPMPGGESPNKPGGGPAQPAQEGGPPGGGAPGGGAPGQAPAPPQG